MKTQLICLANSYKEGGRCLAGIEFHNDKPVIINGKPKWIRPVSETGHGEIPTHFVSRINLLDIIELDITKDVPDSFQSENVLFAPDSMTAIGRFPKENVIDLCDNMQPTLFGNRGGAVTPDKANLLQESLTIIKTTNPQIVEKFFESNPRPKLRLSFSFNDFDYELPITDPIFLNSYNPRFSMLSSKQNLFAVISLGILHEGWHSKLVAGIIY